MKVYKLTFFCLSALVLPGLVTSARAQALFGSVVGNVRDSSDAAMAGAIVTLTNSETRQERQVTSTDTGGFDFATIPPGTYELRVTKPGFSSSLKNGIVVSANSTVRTDVQLTV